MKNNALYGFLAILISLAIIASPVLAVPGIPHQFFGNVSINDSAAPNGTTIKATVDGESYTTTVVNGTYGYTPNSFFVQNPDPANNVGKTIAFFVNDVQAAVSIFQTGFLTDLNLAITQSNPIPPGGGDGGSGGGGGGGSGGSGGSGESGGSSSSVAAAGGGGGGGSGDPSQSRLLRVSKTEIEVGEEIIISALCKWKFGCTVKVGEEQLAELVNSAGFQGINYSFSQPGTYKVQLFQKGTKETLVAEKSVSVKEAPKPVEPEKQETPQQEIVEPQQETPEQPQEETVPATGFFGLGGNTGIALGGVVVIIIATLAFIFLRKKQ